MLVQKDESKKWLCEKCPFNNNEDCGPWNEKEKCFDSCKNIHSKHKGWKVINNQEGRSDKFSFQDILNSITTNVALAENREIQRKFMKGQPIQQIESYLNTVIMDDKLLVKKLVRCGLSAYSNDPINIGIMAPTSEGKTYAAVKVLEIFPAEDVMFIGRMSPTALVHDKGILVDSNNQPIENKIGQLRKQALMDKDKKEEIFNEIKKIYENSKKLIDLSNKIMVFLDAPNSELWERLKPILSHDRHEIEFKITDKGHQGEFKTANVIIRGFPACIFCSAKNEKGWSMWDEIETRFFITTPNMDVSKYKSANLLNGKKKGIPTFARNMINNSEDETYAKYYVLKLKEEIIKLSSGNNNPIWNPFHEIISEAFPSSEGITMRNYNRFTSLCNIETLINSANNYKIEFYRKNKEIQYFVITSLKDIGNVTDLVGIGNIIPDDKRLFIERVLIPCIKETLDDGVTSAKLAEKYTQIFGKPTTPKKILENYLKPLYDYGFVDHKENPLDKRQNIYRIVSLPSNNSFDYIKSKIIEQSKNNDLFVWSGILELERYSIGEGHIHAILDPSGNPVGHNLIQKDLIHSDYESNNTTISHA